MYRGLWKWFHLGLSLNQTLIFMRTEHYNPSQLEVEMAYALTELQSQLGKFLTHNTIKSIENRIQEDNPMLLLHLEDQDGDPHEVVVKIIQRADKF